MPVFNDMHEWIPWIAWINAIADAGIGGLVIVLACVQREQLTARWLLLTGWVALGVSWLSLLVKCAAVTVISHSPLSAVYLALVWIAITPLLLSGFALLAFGRNANLPGRRLLRATIGVCVLATVTSAYASLIEPYWLDVKQVDVPIAGLAPGSAPIRVAVLADIQTNVFGPYERYWLQQLRVAAPDLVLLPGDFFDCYQDEFRDQYDNFIELLRQIDAPYGVYACQGNIDRLPVLAKMCAEAGVNLLADATAVAEIKGARIAIGGTCYRRHDVHDPAYLRRIHHVEADARLLMAHVPDAVLGARDTDQIDLIISGHTHGGQVQIPGFGPIVTNAQVPRHVGGGGMHRVGRQRIYVSRGVGHERRGAPPLRFWCRPEMTILHLVPDVPGEQLVSAGKSN
jgi:predicted MPP superfamily phosphohydrolase